MGATLHLGIRDAAAAVLAGLLPEARIHGNRELPLPQGVESQIGVFRVRSTPMVEGPIFSGHPIDWLTSLGFVIKARATGDRSAEAIADGLMAETFARLMGDQSLGGAAMQMVPGEIQWDQEEGETPAAVCTWEIRVQHRTEQHSIAVA